MARKPLNRPWTFEDNALLVKLLGDGVSHDHIARRMKRSRSTVENYASRLAESGAAAGASGTECEAMTIGKLLVALFATGRKLDPELSKQWTLASHKIGLQIPRSLMVVS